VGAYLAAKSAVTNGHRAEILQAKAALEVIAAADRVDLPAVVAALEAAGIGDLATATLAPDMVPLAFQVQSVAGHSAGAIAAVLGVIASIFLALFAVIYYPVKRMIKRRAPPPDTSFKDPKA
jgi:hypothetical protein